MEGLFIEQLFENYPVNINQMRHHLKTKAAELDLPYSELVKTYNSRLAHELGHWADFKRKGTAFHKAAFRAYFVDGKNIAKISVLLDLATSVGLSREEASEIITTRAFKGAVDVDWSLSREIGITAVPTFVINQDRLVGAHPHEMLKKLMETNRVKKRRQLA